MSDNYNVGYNAGEKAGEQAAEEQQERVQEEQQEAKKEYKQGWRDGYIKAYTVTVGEPPDEDAIPDAPMRSEGRLAVKILKTRGQSRVTPE